MQQQLLTDNEIKTIVYNKTCHPSKWYKRDSKLVAKSYCKVAAEAILDSLGDSKELPDISEDKACTYNSGERVNMRDTLKNIIGNMASMDKYIDNVEVKKEYAAQNKRFRFTREDRMCHCLFAQVVVDGFKVVDYQVPTSNNGHDKIDLILEKDGIIYVTETKWFGSQETMLRCALEIQTYYQKLNDNFLETYKCKKENIRKAILISDDTCAHKQLKEEWAQKVLQHFSIMVLTLSRDDNYFHIN